MELILIMIFAAATVGVWSLLMMYQQYGRRYVLDARALAGEGIVPNRSAMGMLKPVLHWLVEMNGRFGATKKWLDGNAGRMKPLLVKAGNPGQLSEEELAVMKQLVPLGVLVLYVMLFQFKAVVILLFIMVVGYILPDLWIRDHIKARQILIAQNLPDALDVFALMVSAGLEFGEAVDTYVHATEPGPLVEEFAYMKRTMMLGKSRAEALTELSSRIGMEDVNTAVTAIIQSEKMGVSMAEVLAAQSEDLRVKRFQNAEAEGQKAPVKILAPLLLLIMPAVLIVLFAPMALNYLLR